VIPHHSKIVYTTEDNIGTQIHHRILFTKRVVEQSSFHPSCRRKVELGANSDHHAEIQFCSFGPFMITKINHIQISYEEQANRACIRLMYSTRPTPTVGKNKKGSVKLGIISLLICKDKSFADPSILVS
jgi:hypothetical protein